MRQWCTDEYEDLAGKWAVPLSMMFVKYTVHCHQFMFFTKALLTTTTKEQRCKRMSQMLHTKKGSMSATWEWNKYVDGRKGHVSLLILTHHPCMVAVTMFPRCDSVAECANDCWTWSVMTATWSERRVYWWQRRDKWHSGYERWQSVHCVNLSLHHSPGVTPVMSLRYWDMSCLSCSVGLYCEWFTSIC